MNRARKLLGRSMGAAAALVLAVNVGAAKAADAICYNCPPQ